MFENKPLLYQPDSRAYPARKWQWMLGISYLALSICIIFRAHHRSGEIFGMVGVIWLATWLTLLALGKVQHILFGSMLWMAVYGVVTVLFR